MSGHRHEREPEPSRWPSPMKVMHYVAAILAGVGLYLEAQQGQDKGEEAKGRAVAAGHHAERVSTRVDTLTARLYSVERHLARVEKRVQVRDRLQPVQLEFVGPPEPVRKHNALRRMLGHIGGFLSASGEGG